jgi:hypothetical protein
MKNRRVVATLLGMLFGAGCATHVSVMSVHREDLSGQSKVLAVAARNFEDAVHRNRTEGAEEEAARAIVDFHREAEEFARAASRWLSDDNVSDRYEALIATWVKVKQTYPNLKADKLTDEAYQRVQYEWEKTERASGYSGRKYEKKLGEGSTK